MITDVPTLAPVILPLVAPIEALVLLLLQVPAPVASASVVDAKLQMAIVPVIAAAVLTLTVVVT